MELFFLFEGFCPLFFRLWISSKSTLNQSHVWCHNHTFLLRSILWWESSVLTGESYLNSRLFSQTLHLLPRKTNQIPKNPSFVKGKSYLCFYKKQSYKNMKCHKLRWSCIKHFHFFFLGERSNMETFLVFFSTPLCS